MKKLYMLFFASVLGATTTFGQYISEIHYDNDGDDTNELVEVFLPAGENTADYTITLYNGANGLSYNVKSLSEFTAGDSDATGTYYFFQYPVNGIQNGGPDGLALCDTSGVVEFLSYEGTFTAVGECADGLTSTDINISEDGNTPIGESLQNDGNGTWVKGPATPGESYSSLLPVELVSFTATDKQGVVELNWTTAIENNNNYFEVLRVSASNKVVIGQVQGGGTTSTVTEYSFVDALPLAGENSYQLRQVDFDGTTTLSDIASVTIERRNVEVVAVNHNAIVVSSQQGGDAVVNVYNTQGQLVTNINFVVTEGEQTIAFNNRLSTGVYIVEFIKNGATATAQFVVR